MSEIGLVFHPHVREITDAAADALIGIPAELNDRFGHEVIGERAALFCTVEIQGVRVSRESDVSERVCTVDNVSPHFFSCYARLKPFQDERGVSCIGDFGTHALALQYAVEIAGQYGWNIDDRVPESLKNPPVAGSQPSMPHSLYRVSAYTGKNHSVHLERRIGASSMHAAAAIFAASLGEQTYPGRVERPADGHRVMSYGWTGHGQRVWVAEE
ncbi:hypothetical protein [Paraburkholderia sp. SIMBA_054]|uniref:hypothetical protein n=1 Tax=Paraburkholderia sp. SIMBA_054 TaxID=3085795 RepID=UPI003978AF67